MVRRELPLWITGLSSEDHLCAASFLYEPLAQLAFEFGAPDDQKQILNAWAADLAKPGEVPQVGMQVTELAPMASLALRLPKPQGTQVADLASDLLLEMSHREKQTLWLPDLQATRAVLASLLATEQHGKFGWVLAALERRVKSAKAVGNKNSDSLEDLMTEMRFLQGVLLRRPGFLPEVVAWTRPGKTPADLPQIVWEFAAAVREPSRVVCRADPFEFSTSLEPNFRYLLRSPVLEALAGVYDVSFEVGDAPDSLKSVADVSSAEAHGVVEIKSIIPPCGFVRATLHDPKTGGRVLGPLRVYSLELPLLSSGFEPDGVCGSPWKATAHGGWIGFKMPDAEAGQPAQGLPVADLIKVDPEQSYLLTVWNSADVMPDGAAGTCPALHDMSVVFLCENQDPQSPLSINVSALSMKPDPRPDNPLYKVEILDPARFASVVFNPGADAPPSKIRYVMMAEKRFRKPVAWPLFQLRPLHLPKGIPE
jgi:hypothetical protein